MYFVDATIKKQIQNQFESVNARSNQIEHVIGVFESLYKSIASLEPKEPVRHFFIPGRVEVIGKHTDYCGGTSITFATEQGFCAIALHTNKPELELIDIGRKESFSIPLNNPIDTQIEGWRLYPSVVVERLIQNFNIQYGGIIAFKSTLPPAAGMSSSSAFIILSLFGLTYFNNIENHPLFRSHIKQATDIATYASVIENGKTWGELQGKKGVGTLGGSQDHTAILCNVAKNLGLFQYAPTHQIDTITFPDNWTFVIANSGVKAEKTGDARTKYNYLPELAQQLVGLWNQRSNKPISHLGQLIENENAVVTLQENIRKEKFDSTKEQHLTDRLLQFVQESERVIAFRKAILTQNREIIQAISSASQSDASKMLRNQVHETDFLVQQALTLGAFGASAFGAGFGGAVWALIETENVQSFQKAWKTSYLNKFPTHMATAQFFQTFPGPGAFWF